MTPYRYSQCRRSDAGASEHAIPAIILIGVGAIFLVGNLHLLDVHEIFRFWPAILIAVGVLKLVDSQHTGGRVTGGVLLGLGAVLLAQTLGYIAVRLWDLWPVLLIAAGLAMLFETDLGMHLGIKIEGDKHGRVKEAAIFSGGKRVIVDQNFQSGKYDAVFGGFELDMRRAEMAGDAAALELNAVFGGIEVRVPESWSVLLKGAGVFGGFADSTTQPDPRIYPTPKRLVVRGSAVFGGVEVKN